MSAWLTPQQVSEVTQFAVKTLSNWRAMSTPDKTVGPPFVKVGAAIRYDSEAVQAWQDSIAKAAAS